MTDSAQRTSLGFAALPTLGAGVRVPNYDRSALRRSIVHIGVGGFHRAHLATYVDELGAAGSREWSIVGCGVLQGDEAMKSALEPQDGLYTLITRGAEAVDVHVIGSIVDYVHGHPDPTGIIDLIAASDTQIVSMTVTEGGYPVDDLTGEYVPDSANAGVASAFGIIAAGLEQRRNSHGQPLTILSCDNVMSNGRVARAATMGEAKQLGTELVDWIETSVSFPNSMVDRITPATAESDRAWLRDNHGIDDRWPVVTEPFRQWVVEDAFAGKRLPLEQLDVIVTDDVEPYEFMKLRLLNASHSCLAYLAALVGIETVDTAMANDAIAKYVRAFLDTESKPVLPPVAGIDVDEYNHSLIERFSNPAIGDQISRLCLDGTAKFPKFLLPTVRAQRAVDGQTVLAALALAGWCQYLLGTTDDGDPIELAADPQLDEAVAHAKMSVESPSDFLAMNSVFGTDLSVDTTFAATFSDALVQLRNHGVRAAITHALSKVESTGGSPTR